MAVSHPLDFENFESFLLERMGESRLPGLSVAIQSGGKVVYSKGFGFRDIESSAPATPTTLYGIASITKSFATLAASQLADEGKLSFQDSITKYVPAHSLPSSFRDVTLHHLATHSSGLPTLGYVEAYICSLTGIDPEAWLPTATPESVVSFMRESDDWRESKPGESYFYLNEGYVLLGLAIARASGLSFQDYVTRNILDPLRMKRTFFTKRQTETESDIATAYIVHDGDQIATRYPYGLTADGGLVSNVLDLSNYLSMLLGGGVFEGKRIVSRRSLDEMVKPHVPVTRHPLFPGEAYGYGLVTVPDFFGQKYVHHSGSVFVHTGFIGFLPESNVGVAILENATGYAPSDLGAYALATAIGKDPNSLPFVRNENIMNRVVGSYATYKRTKKAVVTRNGDFLNVHFSDRFPGEDVTLVPELLDKDTARFYTLMSSRRYNTEFRLDRKPVEFMFDTYKLRKTD